MRAKEPAISQQRPGKADTCRTAHAVVGQQVTSWPGSHRREEKVYQVAINFEKSGIPYRFDGCHRSLPHDINNTVLQRRTYIATKNRILVFGSGKLKDSVTIKEKSRKG